MKIRKNKPLIAMLIGIFIVIPMEITTQIIKHFDFIKLSTFEYTSLIVSKDPSWIIGLMTGPGTGAVGALLLYYSSIILDTDYFPLKGAFIGSIIYSIIAILKTLLTGFVMETTGHLVHASGGFLGGLLGGYLIKKYLLSTESIEPRSTKKQVLYRLVPAPSLKSVKRKEKTKKLVKPKKLV